MFTIKLIGFNSQQTESFSAILALSESALKHTWQVIDYDNADFFLFIEEKPKSEITFPYERCLFYSTAKQTDNDHLLLTDSYGLPRLRSVIEVFNRRAMAMGSNNEHENNTPQNENVFYPQGLLKQLLTLINGSLSDKFPLRHTIVGLSDSPILYTDCANNVYYCAIDLEQLMPYITAKNISTQIISKAKLNDCVDGLLAKPLNNLVWYLAFHGSEGRLLENQSPQDIVCLNDWPDLTITSCRAFMKLIAFMRYNTVSLADIATDLHICQKEVYSFYNACYLVGLIDKKESIYRQRKQQHRQHEILAKINNRLREFD